MTKWLIVAKYPQIAAEGMGNIRVLKKKMKKLRNDMEFMSDYVFRLRNKIHSKMR